jgi:Subtilase family/PatG C-terminal
MAGIVSGAGGRSWAVASSRRGAERSDFLTVPPHDVALEAGGVTIAVIDGPYDAVALAGVLARPPINLADGNACAYPNSACSHGTFVIGILGAREDALIPGLCPGCRLVHVPLFTDLGPSWASVGALAKAIAVAVAAGAKLINLSLAIQGDDTQDHPELAAALDLAAERDAIVVVAAGNQGRLAAGQLLSHPVTIPIVAMNDAGQPLPDSNFGPAISRRGLAALGAHIASYAPGGGTTLMSGTSAATAVATGTLAQVWSARTDAEGRELRAAVVRLGPRNGPMPPVLDRDRLIVALDELGSAKKTAASLAMRGKMRYATLQGEVTMRGGNVLPAAPNYSIGSTTQSSSGVAPAQGPGGCTCGGGGGVCTCGNGQSPQSRFVYVLGSVSIELPDQSISLELQTVADTLSVSLNANKPLRDWYYRVLSKPEARYVARQVGWILKVEGQPAYHLSLRDLYDLPDLISCLARPEDDLDLFIGSSNLIAVEECPGLRMPVLTVDYLNSFDRGVLVKWFQAPSNSGSKRKKAAAPSGHDQNEFFRKLIQTTDNLGDTDEWRALNFLAVRYKPLYELYAEMLMAGKDWIFDGVRIVPSRLGRERRIVDVVFAFRQIQTGVVQKYFVRVDVSHLFPMIANELAEYFDR